MPDPQRPLPLVEIVNPLPVIRTTELHEAIHAGEVFDLTYKETDIPADGMHEFVFRTPAAPKLINLERMDVALGAGDVDIEVYEDATFTGGNALVPFNRNRESGAPASTVVVTHNITVTDLGFALPFRWIPPTAIGAGQSASGMISEGGEKWVFKVSTNYLFRFVNNAGNTVDLWHRMSWHEEPDAI